jgi:hypothetical protein
MPFVIIESVESMLEHGEQSSWRQVLCVYSFSKETKYHLGLTSLGLTPKGSLLTTFQWTFSTTFVLSTSQCSLHSCSFISSFQPSAFVSSYPNQLAVEMETCDPDTFEKMLIDLPGHIGTMTTGYINEPLLRQPKSRTKMPDPAVSDGQFDTLITSILAMALRSDLKFFLECRNVPCEDGTNDGVEWTIACVLV